MTIYIGTYEKAQAMSMKAKPIAFNYNNKIYTGVFDMIHWYYTVYEDGLFLMNVNTKSPKGCKEFIIKWLNS